MVRSALASAHTKHIQLRHINQDKQEKKAEAFANDYCGYELKGKILNGAISGLNENQKPMKSTT
jgi:predicted metalloenzyme YecM